MFIIVECPSHTNFLNYTSYMSSQFLNCHNVVQKGQVRQIISPILNPN
jgi:hypothetical protein